MDTERQNFALFKVLARSLLWEFVDWMDIFLIHLGIDTGIGNSMFKSCDLVN